MKNRGVQVNDPNSTVLVVNNSGGDICLPREHFKDILFGPKEVAQITWAEFVKFKNVPLFGKLIKLDDSVIISDGKVKIKNVIGTLSNDEMVDLLPQSVGSIKEFSLSLNDAELVIFKSFLVGRSKLGIEPEKCDEVVKFITEILSEDSGEEEVDEKVSAKPKSKPKTNNKTKSKKKLVEGEDHLTVQVVDDSDSI